MESDIRRSIALALSTLSVLLHGAVAAGRRALRLPEAPPRP